jgi:DNA-binding transcriptional MerR regulator
MSRHKAKREKFADFETKYASQIAQLEADGVEIKNKRILARLLEKNNGQVDLVKQRIIERKEKHQKRKEYQHKHRCKSPCKNGQEGGDETGSAWKKRRDFSTDDLDNLKQLRSAGVHGNPMKILKIFHDCNESIEMTIARTQEEREQRIRNRDERISVRISNIKKNKNRNNQINFCLYLETSFIS